MRCVIPNKVRFINDLSTIILKYKSGVKSIEYKVFKHTEYDWYQEFLIVNYDGGARTFRNCNGNSFSAIFEELARFLDSGYYDEESLFYTFVNDPDWIEVSLEQLDEDYLSR